MSATFAAVFIALYVGHQLGDHIAQTDATADAKSQPGWAGWRAIGVHVFTYHLCVVAALAALLLIHVPLTWPGCAAGVGFSAVTHGFIDRRWPVRVLLEKTGSARFAAMTTPICGSYVSDQALHVAALFVSALLVVSVG
jgi:hypothetical protein